jgi:hypothetical protein
MIPGRALADKVGSQPLTAKARAQTQTSKCGVCGGKSGTGKSFLYVLQFSPVNTIPTVLYRHYTLLAVRAVVKNT